VNSVHYVNGDNLPSQVNDVNMSPMAVRADAPARASYHHGDLRNALLQAALKLVAKKGIEGFSLREAARAVGVSAAAAYRHFDDRSALLAALALDGMGRLAARMEEALSRAPGTPGTPARAAAELSAIGAAYVEFAVANPSHFRVMFGPWCEQHIEDLDPEVFPTGRDPFTVLTDTLDGLVRAGAIAPAARAGAEIPVWSGVHGLASLLVERSLQLGPAERAQAYGVLSRTLALGLGMSPALLGPAASPPVADPRSEKVRQKTAGAKRR
jgi:AcrR family transcriptional regulator